MAIDFSSPSQRATASDLTISVSPLGLVELADEEFEVHGPRLNRYAHHWAFYLGHHWGYRREVGEPQLTFNYCKAFADYINNFTFGKGVSWRSPSATEAIIPQALNKVWTVDNNQPSLLWEIGNQGGVAGDVFIKVAWEPEWWDGVGMYHPGRVRIIPMNASHCFPEFHPHDRSRIIRFKIKYRFWGTSLEGTRQVFTYTELLTDDAIEEYVNNELIDARPNPLGTIPVVHIANIPVSGSPWGLSDIQDITVLNREYNEKASEISDIINYHASPVTIVVGAKASQLEMGARKVWAGLPKDSQVYNLELQAGALEGALTFMELLKRSMHELTGVPETALGQMQPISNTSGVALQIQFQPLMNRWLLKKIQYGKGLEDVNTLVIKHLALYDPLALQHDPETMPPLKEGQYAVLDPLDPLTYQSTAHFEAPLPLDVLVKLNEIQGKMMLGLESKRGALRDLGEEFVDDKLEELFAELVQDTKEEGALNLLKAEIHALIAELAPEGMEAIGGTPPEAGPGGPPGVTSAGGPGVTSAGGPNGGAPAPLPGPIVESMGDVNEILNELNTLAYGTKIPQRRNPDNTD